MEMKAKGFIFSAITLVALFFFFGCEQFNMNVYDDQPGRLVVNVTDAPLPIDSVEEANVLITKIEIRKVIDTTIYEADTASWPFLTLWEGSKEFNLMELRNGIKEELVDLEVPAGDYDLIRLYVDSASISIKGHGSFDMKVPSGAQTGIKLFVEPALKVTGGLTTELLLDFNLEKSFVMKGNPNSPAGIKGFIFKPVIRAVNNTSAGVVEGFVMDTASLALENVAVWIELEDDTLTSYTDTLGYYAITGIASGTYIMGAAKDSFNTVTVSDVMIEAGNLTIQDFTLEPVTQED